MGDNVVKLIRKVKVFDSLKDHFLREGYNENDMFAISFTKIEGSPIQFLFDSMQDKPVVSNERLQELITCRHCGGRLSPESEKIGFPSKWRCTKCGCPTVFTVGDE